MNSSSKTKVCQMGKLKIRRARIEDYAEIRKLIRKFPKHLVFPIPKAGSFFVAEINDKVIGCGALDIYSKRIAEIRSMAVLPVFRGRKIGSKLIRACLKKAKAKKVMEVFAVTSRPDMFKKFGFSFTQQEKYILFKKEL